MAHYPDTELRRLWATMERLLDPEGGCPWDREQSAGDIARHLIEEGHEYLEACDQNNTVGIAEEIGDLSYLMVFALQRLAADGGDPAAALSGIDRKLRRRHPHLFAGGDEATPESSGDQLKVWEAVKRAEREEKGQDPGLLKPLPRSMGALAKSHRYQEKAAGVGFDWPELAGVLDKLREELDELRRELAPLPERAPAGDGPPSRRYRRSLESRDLGTVREELGDLLFVVANLGRWLGFDAEEVAESANAKFLRRFGAMERALAERGRALADCSLDEMEAVWCAVKESEKDGTSP